MYNTTCLVTGKTDNLTMHALRNDKGKMIGWVFLHESVGMQDIDASIQWKIKANIEKK